ncbi:MAG: ATP-binding protein [Rhizobacter sp.]
MTPADERILVLAPWGRDAAVICQVLEAAGLVAVETPTLAQFTVALGDDAGAAFITEEALAGVGLAPLTTWLASQPAWSDFPLIVLAGKQGGERRREAQAVLERLGNVVLLERPLHAESLLSAARSALRGRRRQHEIRRHLQAQQRAAVEMARLLDAERRAKEATREATQTLAFALTAAELGTFHCPLPLGAMEWNPTGRAHCWLDPVDDKTIDVERFFAIIHPDDRAMVRDALARAIGRGEPYDVEYRTVSPHGEFRWLRAKGMAYGPPGADAVRFDGITIDISAQKVLDAQRETLLSAERLARLDAEHASRMKDEFLATLSHELRTPLAAIIGWTHVLRRTAMLQPDMGRAVDTIERNARTQARLIDDLLDMSRIISGNVQLDVARLNLATLTDTVLASLEPTANAKRLQVSVHQDDPGTAVRGDANRLQQVVWNLLSNAFKFTPPEGRVMVRLGRRDGHVLLSVTDTGQGITPEFLPFVFERFRQSDASTTRVHGGLGLGLAIVRHLVQLHGGAVEAHSDGLGAGARFTVRLPAADAAVETEPPSPPADTGDSPCAVAGEDLSGLRILVVDDEPDLCELLQNELQNCGATVHAASSAEEAVAQVLAHRPDLLLTDIGMPDEDGYALLRRVRALGPERGGDLPAISLTAFAGPEDRLRALEAGFAAHIAKPVEMPELIRQVASLMRTHADAPS